MCTCDLTTDTFEEDFAKSHCFLSCQCSEQVPHLLQESIWWSEAHKHSARWSLCLRASTQPRFFPSPTCQQWWIVFPPQLLSICCGWRLESWPNVLRPVSISCWHLTANNESIWGLHLRPLSLPLLSLVSPPFSFIYLHLAHCSPTSCVCLSVSQTLNCILGNGLVYLA